MFTRVPKLCGFLTYDHSKFVTVRNFLLKFLFCDDHLLLILQENANQGSQGVWVLDVWWELKICQCQKFLLKVGEIIPVMTPLLLVLQEYVNQGLLELRVLGFCPCKKLLKIEENISVMTTFSWPKEYGSPMGRGCLAYDENSKFANVRSFLKLERTF